MHHVDNSLHIVHGRMLQNAMTKIEDVSGSAFGAAQDIMHTRLDLRQRSK